MSDRGEAGRRKRLVAKFYGSTTCTCKPVRMIEPLIRSIGIGEKLAENVRRFKGETVVTRCPIANRAEYCRSPLFGSGLCLWHQSIWRISLSKLAWATCQVQQSSVRISACLHDISVWRRVLVWTQLWHSFFLRCLSRVLSECRERFGTVSLSWISWWASRLGNSVRRR